MSRILIVDDEEEIRLATGSILRKRGHDVLTAEDGRYAMDILSKDPAFDLLLTDVLMPGMDGFQFYKEIKLRPELAGIPVLILTGRGKMADTFKVVGADGFITKPFTPDDLLAEIEHVLLLSLNRRVVSAHPESKQVRRLLVTGDVKEVIEDMMDQASRAGYEVESASSGAETIAKVVKFSPDLVFLDVLVPDMEVKDVVSTLMLLPQFKEKAVVGYCAYDHKNLADPAVSGRIMESNDASKAFLAAGGIQYIGQYDHRTFVMVITQFFNVKDKRTFDE